MEVDHVFQFKSARFEKPVGLNNQANPILKVATHGIYLTPITAVATTPVSESELGFTICTHPDNAKSA